MTNTGRPHMQDWEDQVNALLDGELDDAAAGRLRRAAESNQALAQAIVEAYELQRALAMLPAESAPASLRRKLRRIPREEGDGSLARWLQPRWAVALAAVLVVAAGLHRLGSERPSAREIEQARQDLAVAFGYLSKVSRQTSREISNTVGEEMQETVTGQMLKTISDQLTFDKERDA